MDGDVRVSDSSEIQLSRVQPDDENLIPSLSGGRMGEPTSVPATVMGPLRNNGSRQDMRDSGHTMESYDPAKFDFPRRVNDEMANILSPIGPSSSSYSDPTASRFDSTTTIASVTTIETDPTPAVQQFPPTSVASETRMRGEESLCVLLPDDGDPLPPSYEQVEVEIDIERLREEEEARGRTQAEKNVALSSRSLSPALQRSSFEGAGSSRFEGMDANGSRQQHPTIDLSSDDHSECPLGIVEMLSALELTRFFLNSTICPKHQPLFFTRNIFPPFNPGVSAHSIVTWFTVSTAGSPTHNDKKIHRLLYL